MTYPDTEPEAQFTPSTEQVRSHYVFDQTNRWVPERGEQFDRWLAERDAALLEAAAQEADRGYLAGETCDDIAARIRALATPWPVKGAPPPRAIVRARRACGG